MHLGVSALGPVSRLTGTRNYLTYMLPALDAALAGDDGLTVFVSDGQQGGLPSLSARCEIVPIAGGDASPLAKVLDMEFRLPSAARRAGVQIMYYPDNFVSLTWRGPKVVSIRNVVAYHYPWAVSVPRLMYRRALSGVSARSAALVIVPSKSIAEDIHRLMGVPSGKVRVVPHGVAVEVFQREIREDEVEARLARMGVPRPYLLFVSALWAYKGADVLIQSLARLRATGTFEGYLALVGEDVGQEGYARFLRAEAAREGVSEHVLFLGYRSHEELAYLYRGAELFVFPSKYESFGNPLLEAMASGVPIVASDMFSIPEVAGDAALLVDARHPDTLGAGIMKVLRDEQLRAKLVSNGANRVACFSWDSAARATLSVLREALARSARS